MIDFQIKASLYIAVGLFFMPILQNIFLIGAKHLLYSLNDALENFSTQLVVGKQSFSTNAKLGYLIRVTKNNWLIICMRQLIVCKKQFISWRRWMKMIEFFYGRYGALVLCLKILCEAVYRRPARASRINMCFMKI